MKGTFSLAFRFLYQVKFRMQLSPGQPVVPFKLPAIDGSTFDSESLAGKPYMLSFIDLQVVHFATSAFIS
ncbi:MAG: hypothetical protein RJQ09_20900 [Cyclobacteriaceae bacterium]